MYIPKSFHTYYAQEAILAYLETGRKFYLPDIDIPDELKIRQACFVSLYESNGRLRGCMGTIKPRYKWLYHDIVDNAIFAAFEDDRFVPLMEGELDDIVLKVETVSKPEKIRTLQDLDPDRFGIIVRSLQNAEGVLLPQCEGIHTIDEQVNLAMEKGSIPPAEKPNLEIFRFNIGAFH
jgi:AmmeMemoRadiSam system protein A